MKTAIIYIRLSPKNRDEKHQGNFYGADAQLDACRAWAASNGVEIIGVHRDIDVSGAAPLDERPGLLSALEDVRGRKASFLLVGKRDRLARETLNALLLERELAKVGARVVQANGTNDDTAEAKMLRTILDAVAEYEREIIRARTRAALAAKKARGEYVGRPPRGYTITDGKLVLIPREPGASSYDWTAVTKSRRAARATTPNHPAAPNHQQDRNAWAANLVPGREGRAS